MSGERADRHGFARRLVEMREERKRTPVTTPVDRHDERVERLARIDLSTLSAVELELIETYRACRPPMRQALVTIVRLAGEQRKGGRP
jgi:hypothetical protein